MVVPIILFTVRGVGITTGGAVVPSLLPMFLVSTTKLALKFIILLLKTLSFLLHRLVCALAETTRGSIILSKRPDSTIQHPILTLVSTVSFVGSWGLTKFLCR